MYGLIKSRVFWGIHLGVPCTTFSRARRGRPPPLRNNSHLYGLANLSLFEQTKVRQANVMMQFSFHVFQLCKRLGIPCTIENPTTSMLWLVPEAVQAISEPQAAFEKCEFCMFGKPWRKSTKFLGINIGLAELSCYRCIHKPAGLCRRTMRPHVVLTGKDPSAPHQFRTHTAQAYPRKLCQVLARADKHSTIIAKIKNFEHILL